jgi:hypothetical protein
VEPPARKRGERMYKCSYCGKRVIGVELLLDHEQYCGKREPDGDPPMDVGDNKLREEGGDDAW